MLYGVGKIAILRGKTMLKLSNVSKNYVSQSKQKVEALRGVDFELPNTGMVFILGKSGSGKSTLLNLLGGLDSPTDGEILVDGVSMKDFAPTDYDNYRNNYVGFIFQEYNLLDDFNVKDNVALALQLSKEEDVDQKVTEALQQVELSEDYLLRRVGEMSGGEKQRVAIARSIVKDSKMILADEPTGNLDSATGESIWNILKRLSESKLVVVVSHDRESAEKYSDRIIEIADGRIVSDNGTPSTDSGTTAEKENKDGAQTVTTATAPKGLPLRACLKMGLNNLTQRKVKTVSVILLSIFTTLVLLLTEMFIAYSPVKTIAKFVNKYDVPYMAFQQRVRNEDGALHDRGIIRNDTLDYVEKHSEYIFDEIVENKQQLLDFGFKFVGEALELTSDSYYATTDALKNAFQFGGKYFIDDNGEKVEIVVEKHPIEFLVGKRVYVSSMFSEEKVPVLAGVIDCEQLHDLARDYVPFYFVREDFACKEYSLSVRLNPFATNAVMEFGNGSYQDKANVSARVRYDGMRAAVLTADGLKPFEEFGDVTLADDEIVLTYDMYYKLCNGKSKWYYVNSEVTELKDDIEMPVEFNQKLPLKFYNSVTGDVVADLGEFKLVGIIFSYWWNNEQGESYKVFLSESNCKILEDALDCFQTILVKTDSVANFSNFISTLNCKYDTQIVHAGRILYTDYKNGCDIVDEAYGLVDSMRETMYMMIVICVIMVVVLVLLVINLISFNITNRKKEIGILSALGTSNKDITKIFILETLIIAAISFLITMILTFVMAAVMNVIVSHNHDLTLYVSVLRVDVITLAVLAASSFGLLLLAAWIPTRQIAKLKPIDAIRNL